MSATLVSSNTTIKVNGAVSATTTFSATVYTAPANSYAILNLFTNSSFNGQILVGGQIVANGASQIYTIYVGPSQSVSTLFQTTGTMYISGVNFINTP